MPLVLFACRSAHKNETSPFSRVALKFKLVSLIERRLARASTRTTSGASRVVFSAAAAMAHFDRRRANFSRRMRAIM